jgi:hypothetical protein
MIHICGLARLLTGMLRVVSVLLSSCLLLASTARAQTATPHPPGLREPVVHRIEIDRQNVFDSTETSAWYARIANSLHVTTREGVVERELLFRPGQPFDSARVAETVRNLRALGIFREVQVDTVTTDSGLAALVRTQDAWTTKAYLSARGSGGQVTYGMGLEEANLLGRLFRVLVLYRKETDRSILQLGFDRRRLLANRIDLTTVYEHLSDGDHASATLALPFYSLSSITGASVGGEWFDGRVLRYFNGERVASDSVQRRFAIARVGMARALRASPAGYLRIGANTQLRREDYVPEHFAGTMPRTITGALSLYAEASRARFTTIRNYRALGPEEDVDLSTTLRVGTSIAPRGWGYARTGVGPLLTLQTGVRFPSGFATAQAAATSLLNGAGLDSGTFTLGGTAVLQPTERQSVVLHLDGGWAVNPAPAGALDLGLERGPRAFPAYAFTGDRSFFAMAEYRWIVAPNVAKLVNVGVAAFADYGGAWYSGSPRRTGTDLGFGLRLGSTRLSSVKSAARIDIARRLRNDAEPGGWVLIFGEGFPFEITK